MTQDQKPGVRATRATVEVLRVLLGQPSDELYGRQVCMATGYPTGTVSPLLDRLAQLGWLASRWEQPADSGGRPPRRYYTLTDAGAVQARAVVDRANATADRLFRTGSPVPQEGDAAPCPPPGVHQVVVRIDTQSGPGAGEPAFSSKVWVKHPDPCHELPDDARCEFFRALEQHTHWPYQSGQYAAQLVDGAIRYTLTGPPRDLEAPVTRFTHWRAHLAPLDATPPADH